MKLLLGLFLFISLLSVQSFAADLECKITLTRVMKSRSGGHVMRLPNSEVAHLSEEECKATISVFGTKFVISADQVIDGSPSKITLEQEYFRKKQEMSFTVDNSKPVTQKFELLENSEMFDPGIVKCEFKVGGDPQKKITDRMVKPAGAVGAVSSASSGATEKKAGEIK